MMYNALGYQYLEAWYHILHLIALLFQVTFILFSFYHFIINLYYVYIYKSKCFFFIIDSW